MAYRNGTYVAFHADGNNIPGKTDIDYYNLLKAWTAKSDDDFTMINSHDKARAVRDTSKKATLRNSLLERLRNSRNMLLIVGDTTRFDTDWVPFEIAQAIDSYGLPIIAVYPEYGRITATSNLRYLWPRALADRIDNSAARTIHIPFKKAPIAEALSSFDHNSPPPHVGTVYVDQAYNRWGIP